MRLLTYAYRGDVRTGALHDDIIIDLNRAYAAAAAADPADAAVAGARVPTEMIALLQGGAAALDAARAGVAYATALLATEGAALAAAGISAPAADVTLLPPVLRPTKVLALGRNFRAHAAEMKEELPAYPMFFHKTADSLVGHGGAIRIPRGFTHVDYEGEMALIIGKTARYVSVEDALDYVAGYTASNDVSERTLQSRTLQFTQGKMSDTFCPLGPVLTTADEIADPQRLALRTTLNGQVMQESTTAAMIFSVAEIIAYITSFATLYPGDVILTGTPEGVGKARKPPVWLQPGDVISVYVEGVGEISNPVVAD